MEYDSKDLKNKTVDELAMMYFDKYKGSIPPFLGATPDELKEVFIYALLNDIEIEFPKVTEGIF
ncbi:hypothetical protein FC40_GL000574 [Ligilactobacillus hayakitensis DSM 18933 = JCM 14209]|uniref:Uncharacterized protein n=1 Tax=Ligilactobacillus hayakitensis DSM 18933 = JCM 14209 TaxID=1423755 RepID=A0A0R1WMY2_9LACO|nr:hypothetical protein [Ligilactobacillus hayakitensis]KRM18789.1 hypothetical protein FC40_GL000574 [Ligilactobacillus hayakitensis DSM 18933 = JCM 14209]